MLQSGIRLFIKPPSAPFALHFSALLCNILPHGIIVPELNSDSQKADAAESPLLPIK